MSSMIRVKPAPGLRVAFARWATAQNPKLRTVSPDTFAVPPDAFTRAPEDILIGALVDGHRYVSPVEDAALGRPAPGELLGVDSPPPAWREASPGEPLPDADPAGYPPDAVPLPPADAADPGGAQEESSPAGTHAPDPASEGAIAPYACPACPRTFTSERGRDTHARRAHTGA